MKQLIDGVSRSLSRPWRFAWDDAHLSFSLAQLYSNTPTITGRGRPGGVPGPPMQSRLLPDEDDRREGIGSARRYREYAYLVRTSNNLTYV